MSEESEGEILHEPTAADDEPDAGPEIADRAVVGALARGTLSRADETRNTADRLRSAPERLREQVREQHAELHRRAVAARLKDTPLDKLREAAGSRIRLDALERAGYRSVRQVLSARPEQLRRHPGVGEKTAAEALRAAKKVSDAAARETVFRFDPDSGDAEQAELLGTLRKLETAEATVDELGDSIDALTAELDSTRPVAGRAGSKLRMMFAGRAKKQDSLRALARLEDLLEQPWVERITDAARRAYEVAGRQNAAESWRDYQQRAAVYNTLLSGITGVAETSEASARGFVTGEVEREAAAVELDTSLLHVVPRGYQAFGAKYALAREHCVIGDEMGLGKTVEALAAMAHLAASGSTHFLVVAPAGVLVNWVDETRRHTRLTARGLHGPHRDAEAEGWKRNGGVAVTTYDTLRRLTGLDRISPAMLVVDEAHLVKNPEAKRSRAVGEIAARAERNLFLTGTPMENRVEEFKTLVSYLDPPLAEKIRVGDALMGAKAFRRTVAPVYLRRNQEDVLTELPEKLELEDWVQLGTKDGDAYREAVVDGKFQLMRRAAYEPEKLADSAKLERMGEIIQESAQNGWKVVVFSYFRDVLEKVGRLPGAMHSLDGRLSAIAKQELVDEFNNHPEHAVLPAQIAAGGVGLNIQSASVVILAEPQLKPSTEEQAIARCHRMGQTRKVHVHRLMAKDTVDQRLAEVLEGKARLFDAYARDSAAKNSDASAVDTEPIDQRLLHDEAIPMDQRIVRVERERLRGAERAGA
ncbi:DEAD/DEAH box helicase [Actinopolyspora sp. H202]|uniref:DEAD/DEAH box helicase n=1 Tax=Actinopolyspora sp. H202 TaxID=1500456 RepID=UPI003EE6A96A